MKGFLIGIAGLLVTAFIMFGWVMGTYNNMIASRNMVTKEWSQVETQYQRRFDLIPNLVTVAKSYLIHEEKVFADIAEARTRYAGSVGDEKVAAQGAVDGALARLLVVMENYPNLKADATVRDLMTELAGTENRINVARQRYNEYTMDYNNTIQVFPGNVIAGMFNFKEKPLFDAKAGAEDAPVVNMEIK